MRNMTDFFLKSISMQYIPLDITAFHEFWSRHPKTKGKAPRVLEYDAVIRAKSLASLFGKHNALILFYPGKSEKDGISGHYTCMIKHPKGYDYYDSYGDFPDSAKKYSKQRNRLYNEPGRKNSLIALMKKAHSEGMFIDYSHHKHQSLNPLIATCGRHCLTRCMRSDLSNDEYNKFIKACAKRWGGNVDDAVTRIWRM